MSKTIIYIFSGLAIIFVIIILIQSSGDMNQDTSKTPSGSTPSGSTPSGLFNLLEWEKSQTDLVRDTDYELTEYGFRPMFQGNQTLTVDESKFPTGAFKITVDWRDTLTVPSWKWEIGTGLTPYNNGGGFRIAQQGISFYLWIFNSNQEQVRMINFGHNLYSNDDLSKRTQGYREIVMWDGIDTIFYEHYKDGNYETPTNTISEYTLTPDELAMNPFSYREKTHFYFSINSQYNQDGTLIERDGYEFSTLKIEEL